MRWATLAGALAVGLAAGCGSSSDAARSTSSVAVETTSVSGPPIVGASEGQRALLEELIAAVGPETIRRVEISDTETDPYYVGAPPGVAVRVLRTRESGLLGQWSSEVLATAFGERSPAEGLPCVEWGEADGDGSLMGCPDGSLPGCRGLTSEQASELGRQRGLELARFDRLELGPGLDAFALEFDVASAPSFLVEHVEEFQGETRDVLSGCVGWLVAVWDGQDEPVYREWITRASNGNVSFVSGVREDLRGCWDPPMLGGELPPPSPCPAD